MIKSDSVQDNPKNHTTCLCCFSYSPFSFLFFRCLLLLPLIRSTSPAFSRNNLFPKKVSSLARLSLDGPKPITITALEVSPTLLTCSAKILYCICSYTSNIDKAPFLHHSNYPVTPQIHLCCFLLLNTPSPVLLPFSPPPLPLVANSNAFNNQPQNCLSLPSAQKCHFCNKGTQTIQSLPHQRPAFS